MTHKELKKRLLRNSLTEIQQLEKDLGLTGLTSAGRKAIIRQIADCRSLIVYLSKKLK